MIFGLWGLMVTPAMVRVRPQTVRWPACRLTQCGKCRGEAFAARNPGSPPQSSANASPWRSRRAIALPPASGVVHPKSGAGARAKHPLSGRCVSQQWFCECFAPTVRRTARWQPDAFWPHRPAPGDSKSATPTYPTRRVSPCASTHSSASSKPPARHSSRIRRGGSSIGSSVSL